MRQFQEIWAEAAPEEHRAIVCGLISAVKVYKDNHVQVEFARL